MIELLKQILNDKQHRVSLIKEFQDQVWNDENSEDTYSDLALDLDYYEPNEEIRKQDSSYYGDERLEAEINLVLQKIGTIPL